MLCSHLLVLAAAIASPVLGFHPYFPPGHDGARRKDHVSDAVSKGFAFTRKDAPMRDDDKLSKFNLRKRALPTRLEKRLNDFKVEKDDDPSQKQSASIDQDGTDFSYFAEVSIGTNSVYMLLDTGSSAIWVMGDGCQSDACKSHQLSSSSDPGSQQFSLSYSSGEVSGTLAQDQMQFAGITVDVTLGLASVASDDFDKYPMDGILGLARTGSDSDFEADTFLQTVAKANALQANVFGIWLDRAGGDTNGEINFGAPDTSRFSGDLNYIDTNMDDTTMWKIPADDVLVDGKSAGLSNRQAVIDSGTTYMFLPPADADAVFKNIKGATLPGGSDMYHLPCDTAANISLVFNNVAYAVSPKDYVGPSVGGGMCYTHIIGSAAVDGDESTWLLGDTFMKNVYTLFDADQNRIGFGLPTQATEEASSGPATATGSAHTAAASGPSAGMVGGGDKGPSGSGTGPAKASPSGKPGDDGDAMGSIGGAASLRSGTAAATAVVVAAAAALLAA